MKPAKTAGRAVHARVPVFLILCLATATATAQIYKWTDEQGRVRYGERPPAGTAAMEIRGMPPSGAAAQPQSGRSGSIPASRLPTLPPEEAERRRRAIEKMDKEDEEKQRAALRDSARGKLACSMLQAQVRDAESGVLRGQQGERRLTAEEQAQILPALRQEYDKACR